MIDRRDLSGFALAVIGHAGLIAAIYYLMPKEAPPPSMPLEGIQVTLSDDVGLVSAAPDPSDTPPAEAPKGEDTPLEPEPAPPEPTPPEPKTQAPQPKAEPKPSTDPRRRPDQSARTNNQTRPNNPQPTGRLDGMSFKAGAATQPTDGEGTKSQATMTGPAQANILSAIKRQVQPCADRQVIPAPEARQIYAMVQLTLNRDGSLASVRIVGHEGVTDENQRYVARVDDAVEAIFAGCTPIRGLPPELYDVPRGWRSLKFRYRMNS